MPRGECGNGLGGRIHVGGLGVVVVLHAIERGHVLQAVLDGLELFNRPANGLGGDAGQARGAHRGQHVFNVVLALERNSARAASPAPSPRPWAAR